MWTAKQWFLALIAVACLISSSNITPVNGSGVEETLAIYFAVKYIRCMVCSNSGKALTAQVIKPIITYVMQQIVAGKTPESIHNGQTNPIFTFPGLAADILKCILPVADVTLLFFDCEVERMKQIMIEVKNVIRTILPGVDVDAFEAKSVGEFKAMMNITGTGGLIGFEQSTKGNVHLRAPILSDIPILGSGQVPDFLQPLNEGKLPFLNVPLLKK